MGSDISPFTHQKAPALEISIVAIIVLLAVSAALVVQASRASAAVISAG